MKNKKKSLLIIEDSVSITWRLLNFLREIENLEILGSVRNGTSGYKRIQKEAPDIILLDLQLPGINGMKIIEMLDGKKPPHIIVLTNNSNLYFKQRCIELGANEFFDKSVQFESAIDSVRKLCSESTVA